MSQRQVAISLRAAAPAGLAAMAPAQAPADGATLAWASFLGGGSHDALAALAVDADGTLLVAGTTAGGLAVTPGAFDAGWNGGRDTCVARLSADGSTVLAATYLGGSLDDEARALALDPSGFVLVAGFTASADFATTPGAFDRTFAGGHGTLPADAFVARLAPDLSGLSFGTLLGGTGEDQAAALAVDASGSLFVVGKTSSADFPLAGAPAEEGYGGGAFLGDAFVARLDAGATQLRDATLLGGAGDEIPTGLRQDAGGVLLLAGWAASGDFPLVPAAPGVQGAADAFVATLDLTAGGLELSLLLGGPSVDKALALGQRHDGLVVLAGSTTSATIPVTPGAADTSFGGLENLVGDGFAALLDLGAATSMGAPFTNLGQALSGAGGLAPDLLGQGSLQPLSPCALRLQHAAPGSPAVLLVSAQAAGLPFKGGSLLPWPVLVQLARGTGAGSDALLPFAWTAEGAGLQLVLQARILDPGGPASLSASNGLLLQAP
jgi:hypothetical protein